MAIGIEAMVLQATDLLSVSRAARQIVTPLVAANNKLAQPSALVNPDEVKFALDKTLSAVAAVERKIQECSEIISALDNPEGSEFVFTPNFPDELKKRAELLTDHIDNLRSVFSLVENAPSWKPYLPAVLDRKQKAIRAVSNLRNAYLNIALLTEQYVSPVPTVESSVEGDAAEFAAAVSASNTLTEINQSEWR